jgi:UDP-3-O-[3-hydroxymyristoyl] glucosamine N-acyltransferase
MKAVNVSLSVEKIAQSIGASVRGDSALMITGVTPLSSPHQGLIAFIRTKSANQALTTLQSLPAMAVLVQPENVPAQESLDKLACTLLVVPDSHRAFLACLPLFYCEEQVIREIHPTAVVDTSAQIGKNVAIGAYCVVGANAAIGDGSVLHSHVTLYRDAQVGSHCELHSGVVVREGCRIGSHCIVHNHAVIGADGFGYLSDPQRGITKVPQVGIAVVGNHVEIGVGTAIDRAAVGSTTIGDYTKIDNHVQIGHNVIIGSHCVICAQVGIAGSASLGNGVVLGGASGVADHVTITSGVRAGGNSGITTDLNEPGDYMGFPAIKAGQYRRLQVTLRRLSQRQS